MHIWLASVGERPAATVDIPGRIGRMDMLAEQILARGGRVTWWSTTFDHRRKKHVTPLGDRFEVRKGFEVVLTHAAGYKRNISAARIRFNRATAYEFSERVRSETPPDIILSSYPTIELVGAIGRYGRTNGIPTVADIRDLWPDIWLDAAPGPLRPTARLLLSRYFYLSKAALASVDAVTGISNEFVSWAQRRASRSPSKCDRAFPFGYKIPSWAKDEEKEAEGFWQKTLRLDVLKPELRLCFFGSIGVRTGIEHVVEAVAHLPAAVRKRIQLVICGEAADGRLNSLKERTELGGAVVYPGWVNQAKLVSLMKISDLGLVPFPDTVDFRNSFPNKVSEYLAGGLAVVTSLGGKLKQLIKDHECGYLYPNQNADSLARLLIEILDRPDILSRRKAAAQKLFHQEFRSEAIYAAFADHLQHIVRAAAA
jgi:glycosyltransferase involved in cell wall biosynthesis